MALHENVKVVIVDNTNVTFWEYKNYETLARNSGYEVKILEMECPDRETVLRFCQRSLHAVADWKCLEMGEKWERDTRSSLISSPESDKALHANM